MATMTAPTPTVKAGPDVWGEPAGWLTEIPALLPDGERVEILGRWYIVNELPDGDEGERVLSLLKVSSLEAYEVVRQLDGTVRCNCAAAEFGDGGCKHSQWVLASGRLAPRPVPFTWVGGESSRLADRPTLGPLDADRPPAPIAGGAPDAPAAPSLADDVVLPAMAGDGPGAADERLDLVGVILAQATAYRAHLTDVGRLIAEAMEDLAADVHAFGSATASEYRADVRKAHDREWGRIHAAELASADR